MSYSPAEIEIRGRGRFAPAFARLRAQGSTAFMPYIVAGDPDLDTSLEVARALIGAGADMLELGIPFTDPVADGPTVQAADERALRAGMTLSQTLVMVRTLRAETEVPIALLTYANVIWQAGVDAFYARAAEAGVDGVIAPDIPLEEAGPFLEAARRHGLDSILLVAPTTSAGRLEQIVAVASGFVYLVAVQGVTGARGELAATLPRLLQRVRESTSLPVVVGFGVSTPAQAHELARLGADGVIVGSALVDLIARTADRSAMLAAVGHLAAQLREALHRSE